MGDPSNRGNGWAKRLGEWIAQTHFGPNKIKGWWGLLDLVVTLVVGTYIIRWFSVRLERLVTRLVTWVKGWRGPK